VFQAQFVDDGSSEIVIASPIPEPASAALLVTGGVAVMLLVRRRRLSGGRVKRNQP
jgi:hypothetical protein